MSTSRMQSQLAADKPQSEDGLVCREYEDDLRNITVCQLARAGDDDIYSSRYTFALDSSPDVIFPTRPLRMIVSKLIEDCPLSSPSDFNDSNIEDCDDRLDPTCIRPLPPMNTLSIFREKGKLPDPTTEDCIYVTVRNIFLTPTKSEYVKATIPFELAVLFVILLVLRIVRGYQVAENNPRNLDVENFRPPRVAEAGNQFDREKKYTGIMQMYLDSFKNKPSYADRVQELAGIPVPEEFLDPKTKEIINCPVLVNGVVRDLDHMLSLEETDGVRTDDLADELTGNVFTFTLGEIQPAIHIKNMLEDWIQEKTPTLASKRRF